MPQASAAAPLTCPRPLPLSKKYGPPRRSDRRKSFMLRELLRAGAGVWCTRQESNLQSFRKSAFDAAAYAGFATGAYKCTGHVADHGRCSRKGGADYSCRRLPWRPDEERVVDVCPDIHYTHFTPLTCAKGANFSKSVDKMSVICSRHSYLAQFLGHIADEL